MRNEEKLEGKFKTGDKVLIAITAVILLMVVGLFFLVFFQSTGVRDEAAGGVDLPPAILPPTAVVERPSVRGTVVFVIDDAGNDLCELEPFLEFPGDLTIAVLPGLPDSLEAAKRIRAAGKEVFLHQPMEAIGGQDPGPGAIMAGMGRDEIREIINRNLDEIWPVAGMNNHQGSRITMDEETMEIILELSRERGILFLDSRTTNETVASRVAGQLEMVIGRRDVFIDNVQDRESMIAHIKRGLVMAEQSGYSIMIGHVWSSDLAPLLLELYADLIELDYSFSSVSSLLGLSLTESTEGTGR